MKEFFKSHENCWFYGCLKISKMAAKMAENWKRPFFTKITYKCDTCILPVLGLENSFFMSKLWLGFIWLINLRFEFFPDKRYLNPIKTDEFSKMCLIEQNNIKVYWLYLYEKVNKYILTVCQFKTKTICNSFIDKF